MYSHPGPIEYNETHCLELQFPKGHVLGALYRHSICAMSHGPCAQLPQYAGLNARLNRTLRTNTKSSVPQILFAFSKEIHVEKVHKFSSSGGELKEGHDALNLAIWLHIQDKAQVDPLHQSASLLLS